MANYQESVVPGTMTSWQRCHEIRIQNPHTEDPSSINVVFDEETIKILPDGEVLKSFKGNIIKSFNSDIVINLRNPENWELTGATITMGEIMAIIGSAYWQFALERDAQ